VWRPHSGECRQKEEERIGSILSEDFLLTAKKNQINIIKKINTFKGNKKHYCVIGILK
jgi:hypothetical protein